MAFGVWGMDCNINRFVIQSPSGARAWNPFPDVVAIEDAILQKNGGLDRCLIIDATAVYLSSSRKGFHVAPTKDLHRLITPLSVGAPLNDKSVDVAIHAQNPKGHLPFTIYHSFVVRNAKPRVSRGFSTINYKR
jgi:hypothetical protein